MGRAVTSGVPLIRPSCCPSLWAMCMLRIEVLPHLPGKQQLTLKWTEDLWAVPVGGGEYLAWRCHLFQGSGSHETEGSQSR